ncbi:hypothetical protein MGF_4973 [Mycoplasmoides gallisepticum str. F]|uniref:Uncharacterized protein n=1 Tax=Mycoplasmoides gallisepticum (strain R(low / passage 15 / clone 2)) TaxID=710127 RepID=D3DEL2_MYCGA|nr:hypothetical protein MGA_1354 [Mycoplasmoides gallisepticum str. R(low)]ADC30851.1 hypothetical protein MGAH_1354 [Mycoplasmoides gallisepticum str. R(high)]ADC31607.1 hypothetical protein MGF_4973 [Mycoplasmoides gallisepticum str. F]
MIRHGLSLIIISSNTLIILILKTIKQVISFIYICIYKDMFVFGKRKNFIN